MTSALSRHTALPRYLNPVLRPVAGWLPPLAVLHHRGRRSGTPYATPVQAFRVETGFIVGLAYNPDANWARNILAAGGGEILRSGRRYEISNPRKRGAEAIADLPAPIALLMRRLRVEDFLEFDTTRL